MGLFGGDEVTSVATGVQRVIKDNALPNAVKTGTISAIVEGADVVENVMERLVTSIGCKADRMFEYARNHYPHGLPSGQYLVNNQGLEQVQTVLDALEGTPVTIQYSRLAVPNYLHLGWMSLLADHAYAPATHQLGTLTAEKHTPVYLTDMVVCIPSAQQSTIDPEAIEQWGLSPKAADMPGELASTVGFSPVVLDPAATAPYVKVSYRWDTVDAAGTVTHNTGTFTITPAGVDTNANYLQVRYTVGSTVHYWLYKMGSGTYPTLDAIIDTPPVTEGTFFPFAYFRYNKASTTTDTNSTEYKSTRRLLKYLGIDYQTVADTINTNPDIADVEQAMLIMAVPANSTNPLEQRYLYQFFDALYAGTGAQFSSQMEANVQRNLFMQSIMAMAPRNSIVIRDDRFKMAISNQGIYKTRKVGSVGAIGSYSSVLGTTPLTQQFTRITEDGLVTELRTVQAKTHTYRHQVSAFVYDEIQVVRLETRYFVWGDYVVTAGNTDDTLLIPLDHAITSLYTGPERENLYARSLYLVFNSRVTTELEWYQSDFFQFLVIAAAVVITISTYGESWEALAAALAADGLTVAIVMTILVGVIKFLVVGYVLKFFIRQIGGEAAMILAILAVAYGIKVGFELGFNAPLADTLLAAGSGLLKGSASYYNDEMQLLKDEYTVFSKKEQEQWKLLDQANKLLETDSILSPLTFFGEAPDQYYQRTVHSGNIGIIGIDAVSNYVERSLSLPTLPERFGGLADV